MITPFERECIQGLARRVAEIANLSEMTDRKQRWRDHNSLSSRHPMLLVFPEGAWLELVPPETLHCHGEFARTIELELRKRIYTFEHFHDDIVIDRTWVVRKKVHSTGWGLEARRNLSSNPRGAWHFDPVLKNTADLKRLKIPCLSYDEKTSQRNYEEAQELFYEILDVRLCGFQMMDYHLMNQYTELRGLQETMMDMYDNPNMLHDAMAFFEEAHRCLLRQMQQQNLLSLNNDNTYHSSGGNGFTNELPSPGFDPEQIRPCDMWASAESQEMAPVSPEQHEEFILQYERRLLSPFGLNGYGCCEDLTRKLKSVLSIPNIRRISISPWADVDKCAEQLQNRCIFSWKPNPSYLIGNFDPSFVRDYVHHTLEVCGKHGCVLEIILKDTHTCENHPERFEQWTAAAREAIDAHLSVAR